MNELRLLLTLYSFRKELTFVIITFLTVLLIPIIAVILLANVGIQAVSDTLVKVEPLSKAVQLFDPTGKTYKTVNLKTIWPVQGVITLGFGESDLPYQVFHTGIDIANHKGQKGDPIVAFMPGKVTYADQLSWGYGKHVIIDHGNNITSVYGHLDKIYVNQGQEVKYGQVIGAEGTTGWSTGPHLHFEVRVFGIPVNPRAFLGPKF